MFLLWVGASISISEIFTGGLLAPLGFIQGFIVIIGGHLIGTAIFAMGAYISYARKANAMDSVAYSFGKTGGKLVALCNLIQLVGWIVILVVQAGSAIAGVLPHIPFCMAAFILSILQIVWAIIFGNPGSRINDVSVVLLSSLCILFFIETAGTEPVSVNISNSMNMALGIELSIAMPVSWLPLVGDHSYKTNNKTSAVLMPFLGYFLGSSLMYILGLFIVVSTGNDIFTFIALSRFRYVACGVLLLSTITTNFVALFSAAVSSTQFIKSKNTRFPVIVIGLFTLAGAVFFPVNRFMIVMEKFLTSITMVFVPIFTILFLEYLTKGKRSEKPVNREFLIIVIIGMIGNWLFNRNGIGIPTPMTILLVSVLFFIRNGINLIV
jgi:putative hydroxymethylpyrimidine transporter CytX